MTAPWMIGDAAPQQGPHIATVAPHRHVEPTSQRHTAAGTLRGDTYIATEGSCITSAVPIVTGNLVTTEQAAAPPHTVMLRGLRAVTGCAKPPYRNEDRSYRDQDLHVATETLLSRHPANRTAQRRPAQLPPRGADPSIAMREPRHDRPQ